MLRLVVGVLRLRGRAIGLAFSVLQASVGGQIDAGESNADLRHQDALAGSAGAQTASVETVPIVLTGRVVGPDGAPHEGAVVVSSAGGRAITDARGTWRLEVEVPLDASSVQVTAVAGGAGGSTVASGQVAITGSSTASSGTLMLGPGGCCQPSWVPTFGEDPGVAGGSSGYVFALAVYDDGSGPALYVGGSFTSAGGVAANNLARWDGSSWSALGSGVNGSVYSLTIFDDGTGPALYAGGDFKFAGGGAANRIARWNGSNWSALGTGMIDTNDAVRALTVYDDGSGPALYAGGEFTAAGGVAANRIARWDGSSWSALGGGMSGSSDFVYSLAVFDDGGGPGLYAGGFFASAGGVAANLIARWDGSSWSALGTGLSFVSAFPAVYALTVFDGGGGPALYAGGRFTTAGGTSASRMAKWDGTSWSALGTGVSSGSIFTFVDALVVFDAGSGPALHAGGSFTTAGDVSAKKIARWNGSAWSALGSGMDGSVYALTELDDGGGPALYAGGTFTSAGGVMVDRIARWDGTSWSALGSGMDGTVLALTVFDDGSGPALYAGGAFTTAGGLVANHIARWDGSSWLALGSGTSGLVQALTVFDDGSGPCLYAGGTFATAGGVAVNHIARWDGSSWSALAGGMDNSVSALAAFDDGSGAALHAGGTFAMAGAVAASHIARWDGSGWSALGSGVNSSVQALTDFDDGSGPALYAGGGFTSAGGTTANRIAKWDGSSWSAVGSGLNNDAEALTAFDDGNGPALYAGGAFTSAGGVAANRIARWDGSSWSPLGGGTNSHVRVLTVFEESGSPALYAGGEFPITFDAHDSFLARWGWTDTTHPTLSCPAAVLVADDRSSPPGEVVNFQVTASDPCGPAPTVVCVPPSGSFFPRGTTTVTCTATDAAGNQATCSFPVVVTLTPRARVR